MAKNMARKRKAPKRRNGPKDKAFDVTNAVTNFIGASITTEFVLNNPNPIDVLVGGWTHDESHPYRADGKLDLRELLSPIITPESGRGWGAFASSLPVGTSGSDYANSGVAGKYKFLGNVMLDNMRKGLPRAVFSSMALPVGRMLFKDMLAQPLNKALQLDWIPMMNKRKRKPSQRGLRKFVKF